MNKNILASIFLIFLTSSMSTVHAHHSFAPHYDPDNIISLTGELTELKFINPHSVVSVSVTTSSGETEVWECEMNASGYLQRQGFTREMFTIGEVVTVVGAVSRRNVPECRVYEITTADGNLMQVFRGVAPDDVIVGFESKNDGMFGTWLIEPGSDVLGPSQIVNDHVGPNLFESQLTEAGRTAHARYDQTTDDPDLNCMPASPWRAWDDPQSPIQIERIDNSVLIRFEFMDGLREVHLDQSAHPANLTPSPLGHSVGRFERETLIVDSVGFSTGVWIPHPGVLMSADARMTEQIRFDEVTRNLHVSWQLEDPVYFSSPLFGEFTFESTNVELARYDCVLEDD